MNKTIKSLIERSQKDTLTTRTYGKGYVLASGLLEIKQAEKTGWELICEKLPNAYVFKIK